MTAPSDTTPDAEEVQLQLLRAKSPTERGAMAFRLSDNVARASKRAIQKAHPEFTAVQVGQFFVELHYGRELADALRAYQGSREHG